MKIQRNLSASSISNRWLNEFKLLAEPKRRQIDASNESRIPPVYSRGPSKTRRLIRGKLGSLVEIYSKVFNRGSEGRVYEISTRNCISLLHREGRIHEDRYPWRSIYTRVSIRALYIYARIAVSVPFACSVEEKHRHDPHPRNVACPYFPY